MEEQEEGGARSAGGARRGKRRISRAAAAGAERRGGEGARGAHSKRSKAVDGAPAAADAPQRRASQDRLLMPPPPARPPARPRTPREPAPAEEDARAEQPNAPPVAPPVAPPADAAPSPLDAVPCTPAVAVDGVPVGSLFALRWRAPAPTAASLRSSLAEHRLPEVTVCLRARASVPFADIRCCLSSRWCLVLRCCRAGCELPGVLLRAVGHARPQRAAAA
jgi:hypothetical protein